MPRARSSSARPIVKLPAAPEPPLVADFIEPSASIPLQRYLEDVRTWHGHIRFLGLPAYRETSKDVPLERLFVEPAAAESHLSPDIFETDQLPKTTPVGELLSRFSRLVLLGDPGSGKSTVINWICESFAAPHPSVLRQRMGSRIPLPFILREMEIGDSITWESLRDAFLARPVARHLAKNLDAFEALLASGQAIFLLDGIDELGSKATRRALCLAVWDGMSRHPRCGWLATSRVVGYEEAALHQITIGSRSEPISGVSEWSEEEAELGQDPFMPLGRMHPTVHHLTKLFYLAPFSDAQTRDFAWNWFRHHAGNPQEAEEKAREFLEALRRSEGTRTLARIPNLLTFIALVYKVFVELPDGRADLYQRIAQAYLENIDTHYRLRRPLDFSHTQMSQWLAKVAWEMQRRRCEEELFGVRLDGDNLLVDEQQARAWLAEAIARQTNEPAGPIAEAFLDFAGRRSGLFLPRGEGRYAFIHLSFQEYFAALYLRDRTSGDAWVLQNLTGAAEDSPSSDGTNLGDLQSYAQQAIWKETLIFLWELYSMGDPDRPAQRLKALLGHSPVAEDWPDLPRNHELPTLVATLSVNPHVSLPPNDRRRLWEMCWKWGEGQSASPDISRWEKKVAKFCG